jgi:hypothetical protein
MFMPTNKLDVTIRTAVSALLVSALLAACGKPASDANNAPPEPPAQAAPAIPDAAPPAESTAAPDAAPAAPVQPTPDPPPPTDPSAAPKPSAANEPSLASMNLATPSAKLGVAADLRYQFDGAALPNQPVILHLAAVPRVSGGRLSVTVRQVDGVQLAPGAMSVQKTGGADVYRQQFSVTRGAIAPAELRVLVTMDMAQGSTFGFFSVPFDSGTNAQKSDSVKQR